MIEDNKELIELLESYKLILNVSIMKVKNKDEKENLKKVIEKIDNNIKKIK